jgi:hypothetical protein
MYFLIIRAYLEEYRDLTKSLECKGNNENFKSNIFFFLEDIKKELFDISACKRGNLLLHILSKNRKCPSVNKIVFLTTES